MNLTDEQIVANCQNNQLAEFGILYDRYIKKIYSFIYYKTHHKETAEDLTSDTFHKVLKSLHSSTQG